MLTMKERQIVRMVSGGQSNKQIAETLGIALQTVKTHISVTLCKMDAINRAHLVTRALERGYLDIQGPYREPTQPQDIVYPTI